MKIDGWHIDGFGVHADLQVTDLSDGLTIIAGPNESGKTTLQHFLVGMLFGFPPINRADHHPALRGGNYGGRLFITTDDGQHLTIHRGKQQRSFHVTHADGTPYDGDLAALLGGASKELFQSVFAVHLTDLAELRALTEDQVRDRVFSAGILGAGRSAQAALTQLAGERDALLRPSGRGASQIKEVRARLADARLRLTEAQRESESLPAHLRQLERLEVRATSLRTDADALRAEIGLLSAVTELWPHWSAATDARHQLDQLGPVPAVSTEAASRLHTSAGKHSHAADTATAAVDELAAAAKVVAELEAPTLELSEIDQIDRLAQQASTERDSAQRIEELAARVRHQRDDLEAELSELGSGRDLAWVQARPAASGEASGLRQTAAAVAEARSDLRDAVRAGDRLDTELSMESAELDRAEASLADLPTLRPADAIAGLDAATTLAALATQREMSARRLAEAEARRNAAASEAAEAPADRRSLLIGSGAALSGLGALAVAFGQPIAGGVVVAIGIGLVVLGFLARPKGAATRATTDIDAVIELAADDLRRIDAELAGPRSVLRLDSTPTAAEATSIRAHADRLAASAQQAEDQRRRIADDRVRHQDRARRQLTAATARTAEATAAVQVAEDGWSAWLEAHDLPTDLDPAGATEFLAIIDRARAAARTLAVTEADLHAERTSAAVFAEAVQALATGLGEPVDVADSLVLIDRLATRAAHQRTVHRIATEAKAEHERAELAERRALRLQAEANAQLSADLQALHAGTVDEAIAMLERADFANQLRRTIADAEGRLDAAVGAAPDRRALALDLLTEADPTGWAARTDTLRNRLSELTDERDQTLHDQAGVQRDIDRIATSADVPRCELQVTALEAELVEAVTAWASLNLAHQMVEGTLAKYQRERQPDVVKRAATLFQHVTGGAYVRLEVRDNDVFAIDHAEREVPASGLSQGATEQLYLCMRIALAESFAKTAALPLLLDDITVNADARRQQQLSELLTTVSDRQQVFAFTCHDSVVEQLRTLRPAARVITLEASRATKAVGTTGTGSISLAAG